MACTLALRKALLASAAIALVFAPMAPAGGVLVRLCTAHGEGFVRLSGSGEKEDSAGCHANCSLAPRRRLFSALCRQRGR